MLKTVPAEAGLGSPPHPLTTNASETTNSVIKAHVAQPIDGVRKSLEGCC